MKLRKSSNTERGEDSLIVFCANYKKEKLAKIRQKYKKPPACLKCIRRSVVTTRKGGQSQSSTPVVIRPERPELRTNNPPGLFYTNISPIPGHNTEERIKRENLVRRKLFEKSLQAIIEEARTELLIEKLSRSLNNDNYINMNANNNSRVTKNKNSQEGSAEDEVYEEIMFNKQNENFYEPVSFNIYEPIDNFQ